MIQEPLFGGMSMRDGVEYAVSGLAERLRTHRNLVVAFSGGKDSTAMLTFVVWAITTGRVPKPDSFRILCVDTRLELPPLMASVRTLIEEARERIEESGLGIEFEAKIVCAPVRRRILVYMLGTGVPPATSTDLRWCTRIAKADPAEEQLAVWRASAPDTLVLTGLRIGESAARDLRIVSTCSSKGGECGAGIYHKRTGSRVTTSYAPIAAWRACWVFEWNSLWATSAEFGDWSTRLVARVYGIGDVIEKADLERIDTRARTGCVSCFVVENDLATVRVVALPEWSHLAPLLELKQLWHRLRQHDVRLRQPGGEKNKDGTKAAKQYRVGPMILAARLDALEFVLDVQRRVNAEADRLGRERIDILNAEEEAAIREMIAANTWPRRWTGKESLANAPFEEEGQLFMPLIFEDGEMDDAPDVSAASLVRTGVFS